MLNVAIPELLQGRLSGSYTWHNGDYNRVRVFEQIIERIIIGNMLCVCVGQGVRFVEKEA